MLCFDAVELFILPDMTGGARWQRYSFPTAGREMAGVLGVKLAHGGNGGASEKFTKASPCGMPPQHGRPTRHSKTHERLMEMPEKESAEEIASMRTRRERRTER